MRSFLIIIILLLMGLSAQPRSRVDSLLSVAERAEGDSAALAYLWLGRELCYSNPQKSLPYLEKAVRISHERGLYKQECMACSFLGVANRHLGNYEAALGHFNSQLLVAQKNDIPDEVVWGFINLGNIMIYMKNFQLAIEYLKQALNFAEKINDGSSLQYIYVNLGRTYLLTHDYDEALYWHQRALSIRLKHPDEQVNIASSYRDIGNVYFESGDFASSKYYYGLCMEILEPLPPSDLIASVNIKLAHIYLLENRMDSALTCAKSGLQRAMAFGSKVLIRDACTILGDIHMKRGNYSKAENFYGMQIRYNDSITTADISRKIFDIQTMNEQYLQLEAIEDVDRDRNLQLKIFVALAIIIVVGVVVVLVLVIKRRTIKEMNENLTYQNLQLKDSIAYAKQIQEAVIPNFDKVGNIFSDKFMLFSPCAMVSGDFYWHRNTPRLEMFAVADSGARGIPGGCMSMLGTTILQEIADTEHDPALILRRFWQMLVSVLAKSGNNDVVNTSGIDLSLVVIDKTLLKLYFSGIKTPLIYVRDGEVGKLQEDNNAGDRAESKVYKTDVLQLKPGDRFYLMTHGYCDQKGGEAGEPFSRDRICKLIKDIHKWPMAGQRIALEENLNEWRGKHDRVDDITISGFAV